MLFKKSIFLCIILLIQSCYTSSTSEHIFNKNIRRYLNPNSDIAHYFYKGNGVYFESIEELMMSSNHSTDDKRFIKRQMIDLYLSKMQTLHYFPIYIDTTKMPVACIFISVGEDGVLNSIGNTKLELHNWHEKISAYNIEIVKDEIQKIELRYPVFNRTNGQQGWYIFHVDESALANESLKLKGDSLFKDTFDPSWIDSISNPYTPFGYPEFSKQRQLNGTKDYIVNWGCRVIEYEIVKD